MHAFILAVGTVDNIESAVVVCDQRVLTVAVGMVISAVVLLLSKHFVYNIEYNPVICKVSSIKVTVCTLAKWKED